MEVSGKRTDIADEEEMDTLCEPCEGDDVKTSACGFCKECEEYMCNTCFGQHLRLKLCRHHTLIDMNVSSETCLRSNAGATKCKQHQTETVKYYCRKHEAVGCGDCLVSEHSGCKITFIKDLSDNFQQNEDYKTCMNKLEKLMSEKGELETKIEENKKNNEVMLGKALTDIKQFRLDINKYLDKVESDIKGEVRNVMKENDILLNKLENECTMLSTKLEKITAMLNSELYKENVLFIHTVECKPKFHDSEKAISDMKSISMKMFEFKCDQQLRSLVTSSKKLGTLAISTSVVFPKTTIRANETVVRPLVAVGDTARHTDPGWSETDEDDSDNECNVETWSSGTSKSESYKGVKPLVAVGARVKLNQPLPSDWYGNGTVTDVRADGRVTVSWDSGDYTIHGVGVIFNDMTLI